MSKRILLVVLLSCGILALVSNRPAASDPQPSNRAAPQLDQLSGYQVAELNLPLAPAAQLDVAVPIEGQPYLLNLHRYSVRSPEFRLLVDPGNGQLEEVEAPLPSTFRGTVAGVPGSRVAASVRNGQLWATIRLGEFDVFHVEPLSGLTPQPAALNAHVTYRDTDVVPADNFCGTANVGLPESELTPGEHAGDGTAGTGLLVTDLACDADVEFYQKNSSNVLATMVDIESVINDMEEIYETQCNITFEVSAIIVRTGDVNSDPYVSSICDSLLVEVRNTWKSAPESTIKRDAVQLFTGKNLGGCLGIAYVATICEPVAIGYAYSVVESKSTGLSYAARKALSAHEIGHMFNALHCCGSCSGCGGCRIMCPCIQGCSGVITSFATTAVNAIVNYANSGQAGCLFDLPLPIDPPFFDDFPGSTIDSDKWIFNKGALVSSAAANEPSAPNSMHIDSAGGGEYQDDEIRTNFINLEGMDGDNVAVSYWTEHIDVEAGEELVVEYWASNRWTELNRVTSDGTNETQFKFHTHDLAGLDPSPFHSEFRLRFRAEVSLATDEWYVDDVFVGALPAPANNDCVGAAAIGNGTTPFSTFGATTDGLPLLCESISTPFNNDIWYTYTAPCSGTATFSVCNDADFDTILAIYFPGACPPSSPIACSNDASGCGQTSSIELEVLKGIPYTIRLGSTDGSTGDGNLTIACGVVDPCPQDLDDDGTIGVTDLLDLLGQWGTDPGGPPDFDGDGNVGVTDLLELLGLWGPC